MDKSTKPEVITKNLSKLVSVSKPGCIVASSNMMKAFRRLKWRYVIASVLLLALASTGLVYWKASRALRIATLEVRSAADLRFTVRNFNVAPAGGNFEWISAPAAFSGATVFKGKFY